VIARLKIMADLDVTEQRLPQDGRATIYAGRREINLRVSSLPTAHGENVVLRILDSQAQGVGVDSLGLSPRDYTVFKDAIQRPFGVILVTGPTGSGKTTTLYAVLKEIASLEISTFTLEDPIEYRMSLIRQTQIKEEIGLTFGTGLRALLRQDPDVILVGECRDTETAQLMVRAALTGHLVFSTLHTNDAAGAVPRLIDMGVEPFLISATLEAVLGQRLLRSICPNCRESYKPNESLLAQLEISKRDIGDRKFFYGKGCDVCNNTGYKGRKGIYELMKITDPVRELINERAPTVVLKQKAVELGMVTLRQDGLRSIFAGDTTIEEVLKYT
jgi:type IV pilus assembly protein PilB